MHASRLVLVSLRSVPPRPLLEHYCVHDNSEITVLLPTAGRELLDACGEMSLGAFEAAVRRQVD